MTKNILRYESCKMEAKCSFGLSLKQECHKLSYTRKTGLKKMVDMANDSCEVLLRMAGWLNQTVKTIVFKRN